jgi:hypothetical protein
MNEEIPRNEGVAVGFFVIIDPNHPTSGVATYHRLVKKVATPIGMLAGLT